MGYYDGKNEPWMIGQSVWQMIWFSLGSTFITLPVGYFVMPFVFGKSAVGQIACQYFTIMLWGNFLFPLGSALSSFFIGLGKTNLVFVVSLATYLLHAVLSFLLIFPFGVVGAAIAALASQAVICLVYFVLFLSREMKRYECRIYRFCPSLFIKQMQASLPAGIAPFITQSAWVAASRLCAIKGADYLLVFSIGTSFTVACTFIRDALFQAVMSSASYLIGSNNYKGLMELCRQAFCFHGLIIFVLSIPFLIFTKELLELSFKGVEIPLFVLYSIWLFLIADGFRAIGMGLVAATRETAFFIFCGFMGWASGYLPTYLAFEVWMWPAKTLWLISIFNAVVIGSLYFFKARSLILGKSYTQAPLR